MELARFGHHPDPAIDFSEEVDAIEAEVVDRAAGLAQTMDLGARIAQALQFTVGGDTKAVVAKQALRKIAAAFDVGLQLGATLAHYTEFQVDGMSHNGIAEALRRYPHPLLQGAANSIFYLAAQEGLLEQAQQATQKARAELAETKRPLDAEMARLNARVIELTGELDALKLNLPKGEK